MTSFKNLTAGFLASTLLLSGAPAFAQQEAAKAAPKADSLQQLLDLVRRGGRASGWDAPSD